MATLRPFAALRPAPQRAAAIAAVPYDVVSTSEARRLAAGNPWSFLHVSRPEIDLPDGTDPHADRVYEVARDRFAALRREAPLRLEETPSLYLYRLRADGREQTGVAGVWSLADYDRGIIRQHEVTRRDKEDDRTKHMLAVGAQTGPVFLIHRDQDAVDRILVGETAREPLYDFVAEDGVEHTLWRVSAASAQELVKAFEDIPALYIADGHHRAASAARARDALMLRPEAGADTAAGDELMRRHGVEVDSAAGDAFHFFLAVAFPARAVRILPYNRVVKDLGGRSPQEFLAAIRDRVTVLDEGTVTAPPAGAVSMFLAGRWHRLRLPPPPPAGPRAASLDVERLQELILGPVLGIHDIRSDPRIEFVGGKGGPEALERLVASGQAQVAFSLPPVTLDDLMAVSDAGEVMPPKSTWFEPKLRDGLLVHLLRTGADDRR